MPIVSDWTRNPNGNYEIRTGRLVGIAGPTGDWWIEHRARDGTVTVVAKGHSYDGVHDAQGRVEKEIGTIKEKIELQRQQQRMKAQQ